MKNHVGSHLFMILFLIPAIQIHADGLAPVPANDSLRQAINRSQGAARVGYQLDLAVLIGENDKGAALGLADSALSGARQAGSRSLEMKALMVLGGLSESPSERKTALPFYDSALVIARELGDLYSKGELLFRIGSVVRSSGDEIAALEYFNESIQACRLSDNFRVMASAYSLMGNIFRVNGLYDRAIESIVNSKLYYEKAGFTEGYGWAAYLLGRIYADLNHPDKALEYFHESLDIYREIDSVGGSGEGVAICYEQIGLIHMAAGRYDEALDYINRTSEIYSAAGLDYGITNSQKNLGLIAYMMGRYDEAEELLNKALVAKTGLGDMLSLPSIYQYLGLLALHNGRREEGFDSLQRGLELAIENNQTKIQLNIWSELARAYLEIGDMRKALECQSKQIEIQNLILSGAANIKIEQLQSIYEIDRKNNQILELERQNEISSLILRQNKTFQLAIITGALMVLFIAVTIFISNREIRQKNRELREANAAKDKLFAIISHDLRGPVSSLALFISHLKATHSEHTPEELERLLKLLSQSAGNVASLLENLLAWARAQLNRMEFNPVLVKTGELIGDSVKVMKQWAGSKEIEIRIEADLGITVMADPGMVSTIMRNLLANAIKFTPRGGVVTISSTAGEDGYAIISVTDTGVGIDEKSLPSLFDITNTTYTKGTEDEKSTGLGLILVREFVRRNGGEVSIESRKGEGTRVMFTLPAG